MNYNDGTLIEPEKFDQTAEELCDRFGGVTQDTVRITGTWKYGGTRYRDDLLRIRVDTTDPTANAFLQAEKRFGRNASNRSTSGSPLTRLRSFDDHHKWA